MFYKNGIFGKVFKAVFGIVALLTVAGGLVSCNVGGEDEGGEETEQNEGNEEDDD